MVKINIGGVNEHFNFPWKYGISTHLFHDKNIDLHWHDIAGGTGEMTKLLREENLDIAVLLTEGIYFDLAKHKHSAVLSNFIDTPLKWGVFVNKESGINNLNQIYDKTFAVSRLGSGSHLMAIVFAQQNNSDIHHMRFVEKHSLVGGLEAIKNKEADVFLWEKYTTKPYIAEYNLKHIGDIPTPWPAFSIACNNIFYKNNKRQIEELLQTIFKINTLINNNKNKYINQIAKQSNLPVAFIKEWITETKWAEKNMLTKDIETQINNIFINVGLLK